MGEWEISSLKVEEGTWREDGSNGGGAGREEVREGWKCTTEWQERGTE